MILSSTRQANHHCVHHVGNSAGDTLNRVIERHKFAYCASNWYVPAAATLTRNDSELPMAWNPAAKPRPVEPEWSSAAGTPLRLRSSAWHSAPMVHAGMDAERPVLCAGVAVPAFRPASWSPPEPWLVQAIAPAISAAQLSAVSATRMPFR
jgi:hypothetical protein